MHRLFGQRGLRLLAAQVLLALPVLHASLHESHAGGGALPAHHPTLAAQQAAHVEHDTECPICAFRLNESGLLPDTLPVPSHGADLSTPHYETLSAPNLWSSVCAIPRAPPCLNSISA